ncbi:MAG: sugar nucleotide-binding protein [Sumerlaeia bacterium]
MTSPPLTALITGATGTVGTVLSQHICNQGGTVHAWNRALHSPGDFDAARWLLDQHQPNAVFHLALPSKPQGLENESWVINEHWTGQLAFLAAERGIAFVYCSTAMVFTNQAEGPFTVETIPDETTGYGFGKLLGERAALSANSNARVARLGWQIAGSRGGNNMLEHLEEQQQNNGVIHASTRWLPATSLLQDTAEAFIQIAQHQDSGIFHVNSNSRWNFYEIACALNQLHGNRWVVQPNEDFVYDQRLLDDRLTIAQLEERLPLK